MADVFGENYPKSIFERTLRSTKEDVIKDIAERNYFLACNKAVVEATDAFGNPIKYKDGYSFIPHYAQINPATNKLEIIPATDLKIYSDRYGRYVKAEKGFLRDYSFEYIDPKEISTETPRLTSAINKSGSFHLVENGEGNVLMVKMDEVDKNKWLSFEYNPETKQIYGAFVDENGVKTPIKNTNALSELAEIFDFAKLSEKDYISTLKGMISNVINKVE